MNKQFQKILSEEDMPLNFVRFYTVGLVLFILPFTRSLFISITSLTLLLVIGVVLYYHHSWNRATLFWFVFIFISAFFFEMQGVNTGKIFGHYEYGRALGVKVNGTPIIIGLNWLFLVYASHDIVRHYIRNPILIVILGALLMLFYDLIVEVVAPFMQMWCFDTPYPPFSNFLAWFLAAIIYHTGFEVFKIHSDNRPARMLFWIQIVFFVVIGIFSFIFL